MDSAVQNRDAPRHRDIRGVLDPGQRVERLGREQGLSVANRESRGIGRDVFRHNGIHVALRRIRVAAAAHDQSDVRRGAVGGFGLRIDASRGGQRLSELVVKRGRLVEDPLKILGVLVEQRRGAVDTSSTAAAATPVVRLARRDVGRFDRRTNARRVRGSRRQHLRLCDHVRHRC